jgi:phenylalanyl-tRNA synthetase alpha chain
MNDTKIDDRELSADQLIGDLVELEQTAVKDIAASLESIDQLKISYLGAKSEFTSLSRQLSYLPKEDRARVGVLLNQVKQAIEETLTQKQSAPSLDKNDLFDITQPGILPTIGHLHIATQAIAEITRIFERIGFTRLNYPEVDWDYYAFESLNMPPDHPARDEWETFFITPPWKGKNNDPRFSTVLLTPQTSNGQVREMEKGNVPIRMINIAKCYRRQSDVSHAEMFHQFEGLYVDKGVSIAHLKGVIEYFVKSFYGPDRTIRLRPFHFQFTEPSFEIDVTCGICLGKGCRLCKEGWLELGGAGMVHPNVLKAGKIDTSKYNGFAFGWGVERTYMMKSGSKLDDVRILYENDVRFLEQF